MMISPPPRYSTLSVQLQEPVSPKNQLIYLIRRRKRLNGNERVNRWTLAREVIYAAPSTASWSILWCTRHRLSVRCHTREGSWRAPDTNCHSAPTHGSYLWDTRCRLSVRSRSTVTTLHSVWGQATLRRSLSSSSSLSALPSRLPASNCAASFPCSLQQPRNEGVA
jgi:hypothetical protein